MQLHDLQRRLRRIACRGAQRQSIAAYAGAPGQDQAPRYAPRRRRRTGEASWRSRTPFSINPEGVIPSEEAIMRTLHGDRGVPGSRSPFSRNLPARPLPPQTISSSYPPAPQRAVLERGEFWVRVRIGCGRSFVRMARWGGVYRIWGERIETSCRSFGEVRARRRNACRQSQRPHDKSIDPRQPSTRRLRTAYSTKTPGSFIMTALDLPRWCVGRSPRNMGTNRA